MATDRFEASLKLQSTDQLELLDVIDTLRATGLSETVAWPQLIVCGDQSSGKSSVLEAISGVPFPRQQNLCTRFATEVILRPASATKITASIRPGEKRTQLERDELLQFTKEARSIDDIKGIFDAAIIAMGLSTGEESFSADILQIKFSGPSQPSLTLVDLPGFVHSATKQQTAQDVSLIDNIVTQYLRRPQSIILPVVSAKNNPGSQIILNKARDVDPDGRRTLGIITKPNTLMAGSDDEQEFIVLANNETVKFSLGWHVVRNLNLETENDKLTTRDEKEAKFFSESNFRTLPPHLVGISFLRRRLSRVFFDLIRSELPQLVENISAKISVTKEIQVKMGPSRSKVEEQFSFLLILSETFHRISEDAVRGHYEGGFFQVDTNPERRLWASVMNKHFQFADKLRKDGKNWIIADKPTFETCPGRNYRTRQEAIQQACKLLKNSRGRELPGLPNSFLVGELFREYSRPWELIARSHIKDVWDTTIRFLELLLNYLTDDDASERILQFWIMPSMEKKLTAAYDKLNELLEVHKGHLLTTNRRVIEDSRQNRQNNVKDEIEKQIKQKMEAKAALTVSMENISRILASVKAPTSEDMDLMAAEEAFNSMNSFYQVAIGLFMDNVPTLAIQAPIIREVSTLFCPTKVIIMDPDTVQKVGGEDEGKNLEREAVLRRLANLEKGAQICKQYALRPQTSIGIRQTDTLEPTSETKSVPEKRGNITESVKRTGTPRVGEILSSSSTVSGGVSSVATTTSTKTPDTSASTSLFSNTLSASSASSIGAPSALQTLSPSKGPPPPVLFGDFASVARDSAVFGQSSSRSKITGSQSGTPSTSTTTPTSNPFDSHSGGVKAPNSSHTAASTRKGA